MERLPGGGGRTLEELERPRGPRRAAPPPPLRPGPGGLVFTGCGERVFVHGAAGGRQAILCFPRPVLDVQPEMECGRLLVLCHGGAVFALAADSSGDGWRDRDVTERDAILVAPGAVTLLPLPSAGATLLATLGGSAPWDVRWWRLPDAGAESSCRSEQLGRVTLPPCRTVEGATWPRAGFAAATPCPLPVLVSVGATSRSVSAAPATPSSIQLQPALFQLLLGVDAAMLALSALLCGLPDGRLYAIPTPGPGNATSSSISEPRPLRARPILLHDLQQPVVLVASALVPRADGAASREGHNCLVVVGAEGEVVTVMRDDEPSGAGAPSVRELHVPGPVLAACCHGARLLYSSPRGVFSVHLVAVATAAMKEEEDVSGGAPPPMPAPVKLYDCCALALCCIPRHGDGAEGCAVAVTAQWRLVSFDLPSGSTGKTSRRTPASRPGHTARDLLSAISGVSDRVRLVSEALRRQDSDLRWLHLCSDVCCRLSARVGTTGQLRGNQDHPVELRVSTLWTQSLSEERPGLRCELLAGARGGLRGPWTLCVEVSGAVRRLPAAGQAPALDRACAAHSFPVEALSPGGRVEVAVPLSCDGAPFELLPVPVVVRCFLHGGLPGNSRRKPPECDSGRTVGSAQESHSPSGVTLLIGVTVVDALSCLRPAPHGELRDGEVPAESAGEGNGRGAAPTILAVRVAEATANRILGPAASGDAAGPCRALLAWLLSESPALPCPEPLLPGPPGGRAAPVAAYGVTVDGHPVRLAVAQVEVNFVPVLEVSITCPSLASLCALHLAVTSRLQGSECVGSARQEAGSSCGGGAAQLMVEAYPRLQALLAEVQALQEAPSGALHGEGGESRELQLYLQLRAARVPLLL
ncbi:Fanconi anemia core complex-associated protein 100 [Petromyzon marinus]|uniref:Fanconi anemia core complex-associated protein 100 n=1 Tax=Petromyzon marinus TaxID=7757 RepID=A0AAJ7XBY6_PETMA|nr:Fanconi anemia core complex-associated protein 100 [Petromyzon marinus]